MVDCDLLPATMSKHKLTTEQDPLIDSPEPAQKAGRGDDEHLDSDLHHLYETIDTSHKSRRILADQNVVDVKTLVGKAKELEQAGLPQINKGTQMQLHKFCLWYQDFYTKHDPASDWKSDFEEDSLTQFENDRLQEARATAKATSNGLLEEDLEHVCDEIDVTERTRQQLAKLGIVGVKDLLARKADLELFSLDGIKKTAQKNLLKFCLWHENFCRVRGSAALWEDDFTDDTFARFEQEPSVEKDYRTFLARIHEGRGDGGIAVVPDATVEYAATITTRYMSNHLIQQCRGKFDPQEVAATCFKAIMHPTGEKDETIYLVSGKTQSGKSTIKAVCAAVHRQVSCFLIVITKGIAERDDLKIKLNKFLGGCRETMEAGLLVIADTGGQIGKAIKAIRELRNEKPHTRFGVIVDEADAMYRTVGGTQVMEQRFTELMDLGPSFRMEISATPFSALQALDEQGKQVKTMEVMTTKDYSGINQMQHLKDTKNQNVFLEGVGPNKGVDYGKEASEYERNALQNERSEKRERREKGEATPSEVLFSEDCKLNPMCRSCQNSCGCELHSDIRSGRWKVGGNGGIIPYTNKSMMVMFDQTMASNKEGELLLVATNPRVYADNNVVVQATCIQNHYRAQGKEMAALVATGRGMEVRLPGWAKGRFIRRKLKTASDVIEQVDKVVGLGIPMVIFGYSRLCRCVSFRSGSRVPNRMILCRGPGYSLEDYIQALGRATFNGLSVLQENGHDAVTILTNQDDFRAAKKYYIFVEAMNSLLSENPGINLNDAFRGAEQKFPDEANFFRHTNRKIGRRKDLKIKYPGQDAFEEPSSSADVDNKKKIYWDNKVVQRVLKLFYERAEENEKVSCTIEELMVDYNDCYPREDGDEDEMTKSALNKIMAGLAKDVLFGKEKREDDGSMEWSAKSLPVLEMLINHDIEDELDDTDDLTFF